MIPFHEEIKTPAMRRIEAEFGKPLHQVIADAYVTLNDTRAVARHLGVSKSQIDVWRRQCGIKLVRYWQVTSASAPAREPAA